MTGAGAAQLAAVVAGVVVAGCGTPRVAADATLTGAAPQPRPTNCQEVGPEAGLQAALDGAAPGSTVCLRPGRYPGPLALRQPVTLWGPPDAVVVSSGEGTTVRISAAGAALRGVTVDGSGARYDTLDAAVLVAADDVVVAGVTIQHAIYGLLAEKSHRIKLVGNHVRGGTDPSIGLRGDTIRLWETHDSEVAGNLVEDGRDMVVWYSSGNRVVDNRIVGGRYGTHFMYSHHSDVERNAYRDVTVGVFVMYSHDVVLRDNIVANAAGSAGIAIGLKDSGTTTITGNLLVHDQVGIYLDSTPQEASQHVEISGNQLRLCRAAIVFHSSTHRTELRDNHFAGNELQSRVDGGGDALDVTWTGNYFDDYTGYDLDDDGYGDVPYELRAFAGALVASHPALEFFDGTPALALADAAAHLDPLFQPKPVLIDRHPRMHPAPFVVGRKKDD